MMRNVSVVLTCYNGARWISRSIESVLAQTYEDFELVIIDDGSTDNSKERVAFYLCDERVRYIYQENKGFSAAVNKGIKESTGNLIGFIGQDDMWMPNKLGLQVKYFSEHEDVDLVHSDFCSVDSEGQIIRVRNIMVPNFSSMKKTIEYLFLTNFIGFETVLVKRKCFDEVGFFDEHMVGFSDHDMWLRVVGKFNIGYLDLPLVKKREHELQLSRVRLESVLNDEFLIIKKAIDRYPFLERVKRKKLVPLYYAWGISLLQKGKNN
ncbi:glycosyltransferase, partial [Candidatus Bathyarchaeota archaeon]|nr:glycosyltransferase [Candidatus Bathyarchaeota archaeon]